jgi:hypothetical protein
MDSSNDKNLGMGYAAQPGCAIVHGPDDKLDQWHILNDDSAENEGYEELINSSDDSKDDEVQMPLTPTI